MFKKIIFIAIIILVLGSSTIVGYYYMEINTTVSDSNEAISFTINEGEGVKDISANLETEGLIKSSYIFQWYVYFDKSQSNFLAGEYNLSSNKSIKQIVGILTSGKEVKENQITTLEGWTSQEIDDYLTDENIIESGDFVKVSKTTDVSTIIPGHIYTFLADKPDGMGLEGYLFPDTYRLFKYAMATDIVEKMLDNFEDKFTNQMKADAMSGDMSIYEIVTLASIIEKEVSLDSDRKMVAGVFYNRLNNNIGLQSDATVNYITNGDRPQPTAEDLEIDSPYNTYKYRGLPPGPISNPSLSSIMAAIYPEESDYFYFLSKINDDGSTVFSKTFEEHLNNKAKYLD